MGNKGRWEYLRAIYERYRTSGRKVKKVILSEFCANTGYHRKYAIRLLNGPRPEQRQNLERRRRVYDVPRTPFERVRACPQADPERLARFEELRKTLDPFQLGKSIERKLDGIHRLANRRLSPKSVQPGWDQSRSE